MSYLKNVSIVIPKLSVSILKLSFTRARLFLSILKLSVTMLKLSITIPKTLDWLSRSIGNDRRKVYDADEKIQHFFDEWPALGSRAASSQHNCAASCNEAKPVRGVTGPVSTSCAATAPLSSTGRTRLFCGVLSVTCGANSSCPPSTRAPRDPLLPFCQAFSHVESFRAEKHGT
jgi:hypothetical protein